MTNATTPAVPTPIPAGAPATAHPREPTIEAVQRDIALANAYRMESIKVLLTIAAALFAFTVAFRPTLVRIEMPWMMWLGWVGLAVSMIGGVCHLIEWDRYYRSYRDHDWGDEAVPLEDRKKDGRAARKKINSRRKLAMRAQFGGFCVGVAAVGLFAAVNIDNGPKSPASATSSLSAAPPTGDRK